MLELTAPSEGSLYPRQTAVQRCSEVEVLGWVLLLLLAGGSWSMLSWWPRGTDPQRVPSLGGTDNTEHETGLPLCLVFHKTSVVSFQLCDRGRASWRMKHLPGAENSTHRTTHSPLCCLWSYLPKCPGEVFHRLKVIWDPHLLFYLWLDQVTCKLLSSGCWRRTHMACGPVLSNQPAQTGCDTVTASETERHGRSGRYYGMWG